MAQESFLYVESKVKATEKNTYKPYSYGGSTTKLRFIDAEITCPRTGERTLSFGMKSACWGCKYREAPRGGHTSLCWFGTSDFGMWVLSLHSTLINFPEQCLGNNGYGKLCECCKFFDTKRCAKWRDYTKQNRGE